MSGTRTLRAWKKVQANRKAIAKERAEKEKQLVYTVCNYLKMADGVKCKKCPRKEKIPSLCEGEATGTRMCRRLAEEVIKLCRE